MPCTCYTFNSRRSPCGSPDIYICNSAPPTFTPVGSGLFLMFGYKLKHIRLISSEHSSRQPLQDNANEFPVASHNPLQNSLTSSRGDGHLRVQTMVGMNRGVRVMSQEVSLTLISNYRLYFATIPLCRTCGQQSVQPAWCVDNTGNPPKHVPYRSTLSNPV
jgi:hypothetical protein